MVFLKQQLSASQHSQDFKHLAHSSPAACDSAAADAMSNPHTVSGKQRCGSDAQRNGNETQSTEGGCGHSKICKEGSSWCPDTAGSGGDQSGASKHAQSVQPSQEYSGFDGQEQGLASAAGSTAQQIASCNLEPQTNMIMEPIDKGLSPGHLVTKELVDKIVRYAEVSKVLKRSHDELVEANSHLRSRFLSADQELASLRTSMFTCEAENVELQELGTLLSSVVQVWLLPGTELAALLDVSTCSIVE